MHQLFPDFCSAPNVEITGISTDSRKIAPGMAFVAMRGSVADGRDYIDEAINRGASMILTDTRPGNWPVPVLQLSNPALALARAAARLYPRQPAIIVAITGTNGKSSVADFLRQIWLRCGYQAASIGTLGVSNGASLEHTTPDAVALHSLLEQLDRDGVDKVALEASSHGLAQYRLHGARLAAGAFTNLSRDHLDYHHDMSHYRDAKLKLFAELLPSGAPAVINRDDEQSSYFVEAAQRANLKPIGFGFADSAQMRILDIKPVGTSQSIKYLWNGEQYETITALIGEFQAKNILLAATLALALGERPEQVFAALGELHGVPGRLELAGFAGNGAPAYIDFAHSPAAVSAALAALRRHVRGRIICVFGCGGDRDKDKRHEMGRLASHLADKVIITDDNPRSESPAAIRAAIKSAAPEAIEIADRAEAILAGAQMLEPDDALLIMGKGHETGQILADRTIPFNDAEITSKALESVQDTAIGQSA